MGVYSLDKSSPKKSGLHRGGGFAELKRRLTSRRYLCLWVLVALVPLYLLRQMFTNQSSTATSYARIPTGGQLPAVSRRALPTDAYEKSALKPSDFGEMGTEGEKAAEKRTALPEKPAEATKAKEKSMLDFIFKHNTIKPAKYDKNSGKKSKSSVRGNSLKLRLKENFVDDGNFGVAEDNDKAEEQSWTAPPSPAEPKGKISEEEELP